MEHSKADKAFMSAIKHNLEGIDGVNPGACPGCSDCGLEDHPDMDCAEYELAGESSFSCQSCDSCGSTLGGDRMPAHGILSDSKDIIHLEVCVDCAMYLAKGELPTEEWSAV